MSPEPSPIDCNCLAALVNLRRWFISNTCILAVGLVLASIGQPFASHETGGYKLLRVTQSSSSLPLTLQGQPNAESQPNGSTERPSDKSEPNWSNWALVFVGIGGIIVAVMTLRTI